MDNLELCFLSADRQSQLIASKELSPVDLIKAHLDRIEATDSKLNSFITLAAEQALLTARDAEREIQSGRYRGPLHGIPIALKDLFYVQGMRNTSGSKMFDDFMPSFDGTIGSRFRQAGAIILGKLNLSQFAFGPTGENADYGDMHNPWDITRISGGSSGGSGTAAASGQAAITMGTDTGGSVRIPSALCGLVGMKATYGLLSRHGLVALSWTLDHPGPMTRTVEDCALALNAIAGHDPLDVTSAKVEVPDYRAALNGDIRGLRIGVPKEYYEAPLDPQVSAAVSEALDNLKKLGADVSEVSWPVYHDSHAIVTTLLYAEAAAGHRKTVLSRGQDYDPAVRMRLETGLFITAAEYIQALRARNVYVSQTEALFDSVDLLVGPMEPTVAFPIGQREVKIDGRVIDSVPLLTQYTRPFNITGYPAVTVPCGFSLDGLPMGLQMAGRPFEETTVLNAAYAYQQTTEWHNRRPPI